MVQSIGTARDGAELVAAEHSQGSSMHNRALSRQGHDIVKLVVWEYDA